jgi:hypothetical protein
MLKRQTYPSVLTDTNFRATLTVKGVRVVYIFVFKGGQNVVLPLLYGKRQATKNSAYPVRRAE